MEALPKPGLPSHSRVSRVQVVVVQPFKKEMKAVQVVGQPFESKMRGMRAALETLMRATIGSRYDVF
jgi:hypothetical protein